MKIIENERMDKIYRSASARDQDKEEQMLCVSGDASLAGGKDL